MITYKFRRSSGELIPDLFDYVYNIIDIDPAVKIYIGTDSQTHKGHTTYVTAIAFRKSTGRGSHVIHQKTRVKKLGLEKVLHRLEKEFDYTLQVGDWLRTEIGIEIEQLEVDYNENDAEHNKSHQVLQRAVGWGEGMGFTVAYKPNELVAVKYADHLC